MVPTSSVLHLLAGIAALSVCLTASYERGRGHLANASYDQEVAKLHQVTDASNGLLRRSSRARLREFELDYPDKVPADLKIASAWAEADSDSPDWGYVADTVEAVVSQTLARGVTPTSAQLTALGFGTQDNPRTRDKSPYFFKFAETGEQGIVIARPDNAPGVCLLLRHTSGGWVTHRLSVGKPVNGIWSYRITPTGPTAVAVAGKGMTAYDPELLLDVYVMRGGAMRNVLSTAAPHCLNWDLWTRAGDHSESIRLTSRRIRNDGFRREEHSTWFHWDGKSYTLAGPEFTWEADRTVDRSREVGPAGSLLSAGSRWQGLQDLMTLAKQTNLAPAQLMKQVGLPLDSTKPLHMDGVETEALAVETHWTQGSAVLAWWRPNGSENWVFDVIAYGMSPSVKFEYREDALAQVVPQLPSGPVIVAPGPGSRVRLVGVSSGRRASVSVSYSSDARDTRNAIWQSAGFVADAGSVGKRGFSLQLLNDSEAELFEHRQFGLALSMLQDAEGWLAGEPASDEATKDILQEIAYHEAICYRMLGNKRRAEALLSVIQHSGDGTPWYDLAHDRLNGSGLPASFQPTQWFH